MSKCREGFTDAANTTPGAAGWLWECPNMKALKSDRDMSGDNYECKVCGRRTWIDYDEIR